jgi:hypothetical protein
MSFSFISYAREDKPFVVRLDKALRAAGSTLWVDWQDIPPSAKWMDEIRRGIIAADAFVFVVSPASAASRSCGWEISIAAENNKRIIPLVAVSDESLDLPPAGFRAGGQKADWAEDSWFLHRYQDRKRGRLRTRAVRQGAALSALAVSPGERVLASGDFKGGLRVCDAQTGDETLKFDVHQGPISAMTVDSVVGTGSQSQNIFETWERK